jgi:hypothetical protein
MKNVLIAIFIIASIGLITFLNISLSRATQIESFLTHAKPLVIDSTIDKLYITTLSTTMNPNETFLIEEPLYKNTHETFALKSEVSIYVYTEGKDPRPYFIVSVNNIQFKSETNIINKDTLVYSTFVFEEENKSGLKDIKLFFSHLYDTSDQLFSIDTDELFIGTTFNLQSIQIVLRQNDELYDVATINLIEHPGIEETIKELRAINNIETLQSKASTYESTELLSIYESHVVFPLKNVIIEILVLLSIYVLIIYIRKNRIIKQ